MHSSAAGVAAVWVSVSGELLCEHEHKSTFTLIQLELGADPDLASGVA